jgi:pimeloyl-ACP methyl ester carboxylesterase
MVMGTVGRARPLRGLSGCTLVAAFMMAGTLSSMADQAQSTSPPSPPVKEVGSTVVALDASRGSGVYPVYASADLQAGTAAGRQALVIVHGRLRNASDYFATGLDLAKRAGAAGRVTIVVAPQLLNQSDVTTHRLPDRYLRWNRDWEAGMPALGPSPASSYDVLDDIVAKLSNTSAFPDLQRIVFVGHGGGAQMLARYAVVMRPRSGPAIRFVIANSGTYLYLTTARPLPPACQEFNMWKYGLSDPPPYVGDLDKTLKDFAARDVTLLLGDKDRKSDGVLDQSCAAKAQGPNRFKRGQYFVNALTASGMAPRLRHAIVRGVGHNEKNMLTSDQALDAIFATGNAVR